MQVKFDSFFADTQLVRNRLLVRPSAAARDLAFAPRSVPSQFEEPCVASTLQTLHAAIFS